MEMIASLIEWFINFVLHMDEQLPLIISSIGGWTYLVLFLVIFVETGLVVMPFLPGDSRSFYPERNSAPAGRLRRPGGSPHSSRSKAFRL